MISTIEADIIGMTFEALLTGVYFASFLLCLRWLIFSDDGGTLRKPIHWPFFVITIILFAFSMTNFGLCLKKTALYSQGASINTFVDVEISNMSLEMLAFVITDGVLIFRCWTVYNRSWRIAILPLLLLLYNISSLVIMMYCGTTFLLTGNEDPISLYDQIYNMLYAYYATTIAINIYATSAITFYIWRHCRLSRRLARFAIRVIAESGLLYTLTSIAAFCSLFPNFPGGFSIASAINNRTAGIAFNLILIRVAQNRANPEAELPTFIGDSTIERAIPAAPRHNSEMVSELNREEL
ncbi:hypothetical protein F5887DRAFT_78613 [Amanita rubescens]|nr:hypothetical protein F5887DRAFT_78613 [Amanita rubescens]